MYVCLCNSVTDRQLVEAAAELASAPEAADAPTVARQVADRLGAGLGCGSCREFALDLVERAASQHVSVILNDHAGDHVRTPLGFDVPPSGHGDLLFPQLGTAGDDTLASRRK